MLKWEIATLDTLYQGWHSLIYFSRGGKILQPVIYCIKGDIAPTVSGGGDIFKGGVRYFNR